MLPVTVALVAQLAYASDPVVSVGDEVSMRVGGNWARAYPAEEGWNFLWAAGGDYNLLPMTDALTVDDRDRKTLTGRTNLIDHSIQRCADGSFLHVASANVDAFNDSAYADRLDANFELLGAGTIEEQNPDRQHNDLAAVCSPILTGVAFDNHMGEKGSLIFTIDGSGQVSGTTDLTNSPKMMGGSLVWDPDNDNILAIGASFDNRLTVTTYDQNLNLLDDAQITVLPKGYMAYWPQAVMRVGDYWLVAHMGRNETEGWASDEGNVYLETFDLSWTLLDTQQLTKNTAPTGGMRPGLARKNGSLLMLYDKNVAPYVVPVALDEEFFGIGGGDTGNFPTDSGTHGGGDTDDSAAGGEADGAGGGDCGCATPTPSRLSLMGLLLIPWWRRRCSS